MSVINHFKTLFLLTMLIVIAVVLGRLVGGPRGAALMLGVSLLGTFLSYYFSDKFVLFIYNARKLKEEDEEELFAMVRELSERASVPMPQIYWVPDNAPNAFATGRNRSHAAIVYTQGLLQLLSKEELQGVTAHELSHIKNYDLLLHTIAAGICQMISLFAYLLKGGVSRRRRGNPFYFLAIGIVTPFMAFLLQTMMSRTREYAADHEGGMLTGDPLKLAAALKRIHKTICVRPMEVEMPATAHFFIVSPLTSGLSDTLFSTHPPIEDRIDRLEKQAESMQAHAKA